MALSAAELQVVNEALGVEVSFAAVARLYKASDSGSWYYPNIWGGVALVTDGTSSYIRIVDLSGGALLYEQELYEKFDYNFAKPFFHVFEGDDCVHGLSFADVSDATTFGNSVRQAVGLELIAPPPSSQNPPLNGNGHQVRHPSPNPKPLPSLPPKTPSPQSSVYEPAPTPTASTPPVVIASPAIVSSPPPAGTSKPAPMVKTESSRTLDNSAKKNKPASSSSWGGWFSSVLGGGNKVEENIEISRPENFRHQAHIGWSAENGFDVRNIPPEWKKLFAAAGVTKKELKNGETSKFILETVTAAVMGPPMPTAGGGAGGETHQTPTPQPPEPTPPPLVPPPQLTVPPPLTASQKLSPRKPPAVPTRTASSPGMPSPRAMASPRGSANAQPAAPPLPPISASPGRGTPSPVPSPRVTSSTSAYADGQGQNSMPPQTPTGSTTSAPPPPPAPPAPPAPPPPPGPGVKAPPSAPPPPKKAAGPPLVDRPSGSSLLLHQIQQGTQLRKAPPAGELPDLKALNKDEAKTLESTLAAAMQARRAVIQTPDDDEDDGGAWSD